VDALLHLPRPEVIVAEVFVEFEEPIVGEDGERYIARACGSEMRGGRWQGWVEFLPVSGDPVRSARETTQPNRQDTIYWATGLTPVFLQGSLRRALHPLVRPIARVMEPPRFGGPAEPIISDGARTESILDPFSVYRKGEALLRRQLSAFAGWHLVNIIQRYGLSAEDPAVLSAREPRQLVELIIAAVRGSHGALRTPQAARGRPPAEA
jgi:hypothetical protein